jgi:hypothetical protein
MPEDDSRYHRQREDAMVHPNRKQKDKSYHDPERPYAEVAGQIENALTLFKQTGVRRGKQR